MDENSIWQCVDDDNIAWHCGAKTGYKHPYCRNANSIGIEMCSRMSEDSYYFLEDTEKNAAYLTALLMRRYSVPMENIIRHFDVTGKLCPRPYVDSEMAWQAFKERIKTEPVKEYTKINDIAWELAARGIVTDTQGLLEEVAQNPNGRLYWVARKCVQYIRALEQKQSQ